MRGVFTVLIFLFSIMESSSQEMVADRAQCASGRFYSSDKERLTNDLIVLFEECIKTKPSGIARAIIVPHAGYIYSGETAASAYATTAAKGKYKNIFIIGTTHVRSFDGASIYSSGDYMTPLGRAVVNKDIAGKLKSYEEFSYPDSLHNNDHNIEVQIPFIQFYFKDSPTIIPIIIGTDDRKKIEKMAEILKPWFTEENLFVISSDFSHYPSYEDALLLDNLTAEALMTGKPDIFIKTLQKNSSMNVDELATSMCGWSSALLFLEMIEGNDNLRFHKISYCNSGDSPYGNKESVVGYNAIGLYGQVTFEFNDLSFTKEEKEMLFIIARRAIELMLNENKVIEIDDSQIAESLKNRNGAFVSLKLNGELRGCIGRFVSEDPLFESVKLSAISSAFEDSRFNNLSKQEYRKIDIEITVLGPLKRITDKSEIVIGKHGIYIKQGAKAGTMLPQVAIENGWDVDEFLNYTSEHKAGIGRDGWKTAELYIYEGLVLTEKE